MCLISLPHFIISFEFIGIPFLAVTLSLLLESICYSRELIRCLHINEEYN